MHARIFACNLGQNLCDFLCSIILLWCSNRALKTHLVPAMHDGPLAAKMNVADVGKHKLDGLILIGGHRQQFQTHKV